MYIRKNVSNNIENKVGYDNMLLNLKWGSMVELSSYNNS